MSSRLKIPNKVLAIFESKIKTHDLSENNVCADIYNDAHELDKAYHWLLFLSNIVFESKHRKVVIKLISASSDVTLLRIKP